METHGPRARLAYRSGQWEEGSRQLPSEVPVALVFNGTTQAVMMATPADLEDFAYGFSLTEGIVHDLSDIREIETVEQEQGLELRMWLVPQAEARFQARRRAQVGPVGCGLCGIDSLGEALRPLPTTGPGGLSLTPGDVASAMSLLAQQQSLNSVTRAAHAAGFYHPTEGVVLAREDVGRHNALDKLAGAIARSGRMARDGALVITSRISVDMVQKAAMIGAPALLAASAPTALAVAEAEAAGITLVAVVRGADFEIFTHPERFSGQRTVHVA